MYQLSCEVVMSVSLCGKHFWGPPDSATTGVGANQYAIGKHAEAS